MFSVWILQFNFSCGNTQSIKKTNFGTTNYQIQVILFQ
jgi:hypothetical protein